MPIVNLTPHPVTLYSHVPESPVYVLAADGRHRLWASIPDPCGSPADRLDAPVSYTEWPATAPPARLQEHRGELEQIVVPDSIVDVPTDRHVPVRAVSLGAVTGLPAPTPGTWYIVSIPVVDGARREGRTTSDLLTPGDLVRDPAGTILGVTSFYRWPDETAAAQMVHPAVAALRASHAQAQQTIADLQRVREAQDARIMEQQRELVALTTTTLGAS